MDIKSAAQQVISRIALKQLTPPIQIPAENLNVGLDHGEILRPIYYQLYSSTQRVNPNQVTPHRINTLDYDDKMNGGVSISDFPISDYRGVLGI